ncbi:uncharacterized protein LOC135162839 isoform X2 [Diachasmimorpha longicaudata]
MNATHSGTYLPYPDVCNCCEYCLTNIVEGGSCMTGAPGMLPPTDICGPGLACLRHDNGTSTCQKMAAFPNPLRKCSKGQKEWDQRKAGGQAGFLEVRPKCDDDGLFAPFHCIPGSICYCVSPDGERIFGESAFLNSADEFKMTCGCSINDWRARKTIEISHWENLKKPVFTARCTEHGLFDQLQCMLGDHAKCVCVDPIQGHPNTLVKPVNVAEIAEGRPSCFDPKRHTPGSFTTDCEYLRDISSQLPLGRTPPLINPVCQLDGMFHRVQTSGSKKICVDPSGNQIRFDGINFETGVNSIEASAMDCNCARTVWLLSQSGIEELPKCCSFGNFEHWQHRRKQYYCVDRNGDQIGLERDAPQDLNCYKQYNGQPCSIQDSKSS